MPELIVLLVVISFAAPIGPSRIERDGEFPCGVPRRNVGLVVGGEEIRKGDFPWLAALLKTHQDGKRSFFCGAVLVSKTKVLTAAHCIQYKNVQQKLLTRDLTVLLGVHDLYDVYQPGIVAISPTEVLVHPDWNPFSKRFDADLAIILTEGSFNFDWNIIPICLLQNGNDQNLVTGTVVGFGQSEDKTKIHETKPRKVEVHIKNNAQCFIENYEFAKISSNRTFCGGSKNGSGPCRGDSGSGLFIKSGSAFFLKGIVSSSLFDENGNCDVNNFAVFTDVTKYLRWIDNPLNPESVHNIPQNTALAEGDCGVMSDETSLLNGSKDVPASLFPWAVAIFVKEDVDLFELTCVGSLISNKHIVAIGSAVASVNAANALVPIDVKRLKMYFGASRLGDVYQSGVLIVEGAEDILLHPQIQFQPRHADIALILLSSPIYFTSSIRPICLPMFGDETKRFVGRTGYTVGWGTDENGEYSDQKKTTKFKVRNADNDQLMLRERIFSASTNDPSPCDLSDPFYMKNKGKWTLRGLYYFATGDKDEDCKHGISLLATFSFEDLVFYVDWIYNILNRVAPIESENNK